MDTHNTLEEVLSNIIEFGKNNFIIVTGGIGDFLTVDSFFLYTCTKNIIFITKQSLQLRNVLNFYKKKMIKNFIQYTMIFL